MKSLERNLSPPKIKETFYVDFFGCSYPLMVYNFHLSPLLSVEVEKEINVEQYSWENIFKGTIID